MSTGSVVRSSAILSSCKLKGRSIIVLWGKYPSFASSFCLLFVFVNDSIWQIYIYQNNDVDFVLCFIRFDEKSQTVNSFINADCRWCRYLTFLVIYGVCLFPLFFRDYIDNQNITISVPMSLSVCTDVDISLYKISQSQFSAVSFDTLIRTSALFILTATNMQAIILAPCNCCWLGTLLWISDHE